MELILKKMEFCALMVRLSPELMMGSSGLIRGVLEEGLEKESKSLGI